MGNATRADAPAALLAWPVFIPVVLCCNLADGAITLGRKWRKRK